MQALISNAPQGSPEWLIARIPYVTGCNVSDVMAKGQGKSRQTYLTKKVLEILTGKPVEGYKSSHMKNGNKRENEARRLYALVKGVKVKQLGFAYLPSEGIGASIDGDVDEEGLVEFKVVLTNEQKRLIRLRTIPGKYVKQMNTQMYVLNKKWCDYTSVCFGKDEHGDISDKDKIMIIRVYRDDQLIENIRKEVAEFHLDIHKTIKKLAEMA